MTPAELVSAADQARPDLVAEIGAATTQSALDSARVHALGQRSLWSAAASAIGAADKADRPELGRRLSALRKALDSALAAQADAVAAGERRARLRTEHFDLTLPGRRRTPGVPHPVTQVIEEIEDLFVGMGYRPLHGSEVETDWYNFEALNLPKVHSARSMQDTVYVAADCRDDGEVLLRTHTSAMQVRAMLAEKPPLYIVSLGRCVRRDTADSTHVPTFHQVEAFAVDTRITFGDLAGTIEYACKALFGAERTTRLRPSYFPYTEPSAEVDVSCFVCDGTGVSGGSRQARLPARPAGSALPGAELRTPESRNGDRVRTGCTTCHGSGWIELGGSGMIHPNVFRAVGYDPDEVSGFALGWGIERIVMLRHGVPDLRLFLDNDLRFLEQFHAAAL